MMVVCEFRMCICKKKEEEERGEREQCVICLRELVRKTVRTREARNLKKKVQ